MGYIKKEELIIGEIYNCANISGSKYIVKIPNDLYNSTNINKDVPRLHKMGNFTTETLQWSLATPEEKHWLNCCITADKFITFEEAMKTFIPEYVECTQEQYRSSYKAGIIYKLKNTLIKNEIGGMAYWTFNQHRFKPSTKEAYDAQFVVKDPEFMLPEKWYIQRNSENFEVLNEWENNKRGNFVAFNQSNGCSMFSDKDYCYTKPEHISDYTEITFEQFKKYVLKEETIEEVIEPLPQFKVIESIETITKVENNEGNQFFIGDIVKSSNGVIQTIESFDYNKAKTNIIAFTNKQPKSGNGIGIDKIEHCIESKVEETLLEKAKRLYPIGTKFKCLVAQTCNIVPENITFRLGRSNDNTVYSYINNAIFHQHYNGEIWAKIIEEINNK